MQIGSLRKTVEAQVARRYPSPIQYQQILTPFQAEQAKAGRYYMGNPAPTGQSNLWMPLIVVACVILYMNEYK